MQDEYNMTAAVHRSGTPALSVPQTQNTAPVLEFNCLYTHDIKRKQKRWQDGFLRFHTFNKRVMVYDVPRNFIGDAHWKSEEALQDGDEVMLEKDGVMVQVAESVGRTETDLTELRKRTKKASSEHGSSSPMKAGQTPARTVNSMGGKPATQLKHRSLNALLGTPKGPIGKAALPTRSPFEERHADGENEMWTDGRPAKRRRTEQPPAWNVTRTTKAAAPSPQKEMPLWARTADSAKKRKGAPLQEGQRRLGTREVIDLCEDADEPHKFLPGFSSDALAPPSSPQKTPAPAPPAPKQASVRSRSPAFQTQRVPAKASGLNERREHGPRPDLPPGSPQTSRLMSRDGVTEPTIAREVLERHTTELERSVSPLHQTAGATRAQPGIRGVVQPEGSHSGKTLRMTASAPKKKTLLCQNQLSQRPSQKPSRAHSANTEVAIDSLLDATSQHNDFDKQKAKSQRKKLEERLARIDKKRRDLDGDEISQVELSRKKETLRQRRNDTLEEPSRLMSHSKVHSRNLPETNAVELAELDQMIMPPQRLPSPLETPQVQTDRQLRRVVSETNSISSKAKKAPGAPVRYTPSPVKKSPTPVAQSEAKPGSETQPRPPIAGPSTARSKKPMQRAVSLNTRSNGTSTVILSKQFQTPKAPQTVAPPVVAAAVANAWSREAFDLLTWRPPGWDEEKWCFGDADGISVAKGP